MIETFGEGDGGIYSYGMRPVLKLDSSVVVIGGSGIETDPYKIAKWYTKKYKIVC